MLFSVSKKTFTVVCAWHHAGAGHLTASTLARVLNQTVSMDWQTSFFFFNFFLIEG